MGHTKLPTRDIQTKGGQLTPAGAWLEMKQEELGKSAMKKQVCGQRSCEFLLYLLREGMVT